MKICVDLKIQTSICVDLPSYIHVPSQTNFDPLKSRQEKVVANLASTWVPNEPDHSVGSGKYNLGENTRYRQLCRRKILRLQAKD